MWWARTMWASTLLFGNVGGCLWISAADHVRRTDQDGDGVAQPEDCNDDNGTVYPGAAEVPCDGVDNDCNPNTVDSPASLRTVVSSTEVKTVTYDSIARALEGARPGDTLQICPGRWYEQLVITVPSLTVSGSSTPEATVFDADGLDGPVIEIRAADVTIQALTVVNGVGRNREGSGTWGGGIYAWDATGTVTLNQVIVSENLANAGGGVVGPEAGNLVLANTIVRNNRATSDGGGVYVTRAGSFTNSVITQNIADQRGGGLAVGAGAELSLLGTTEVRLNTAPSGAGVVIEAQGSLSGGWVVENTATDGGGGVVSRGGDLTDVKIEGNISEREGGGLTIFGGTVTRGSFLDNLAPQGGGMYVTGNVDVRGTYFEGNFAVDGDGGAILAEDGLLSVASDGAETEPVEAGFLGNASVDGGGAIAVAGASLDVTGGQIAGCAAESGGGIAIIDTGDCPACTYLVTGLRLNTNGAERDGGGIWTNRSVTLRNVDFDGNLTYGDGGGLYASGAAVVTLEGATGTENVADTGAVAAFFTVGAPAPSTLVAATFSKNTADESGSVLMVGSGTVNVSASQFEDNDAGRGAAVAVEQFGTYGSDGVTYRDNVDHDLDVLGLYCSVPDDDATFVCEEAGGNGSCSPSTACQ